MRAPSLASDVLLRSLSSSAPRSTRRVLLSPVEFQQRLRRGAFHRGVSNGTHSVGWGAKKPDLVEAKPTTRFEPLIIETPSAPSVSPPPTTADTGKQRLHRSRSAFWAHLKKNAHKGDKQGAQAVVKELLYHYDEKPSVQMYAALIAAETDPKHGCAADVERLLEELDATGLPRELEIYDAALKALSIHPDHILRESLLDAMKRTWLELNAEHWHYIVTGLLRERQLELALERLGAMRSAGVPVQPWLLHLLITTCLSVSAFPEALSLLQYRATYPDPVPSAIWTEALSRGANSLCHPLVDHVWRRAVETHFISPPTGTVIAVLDTAARRANFRLAADAIRLLRQRSSPLDVWHYEAAFEAFLHAGDLPGALGILRVMATDGKPASAGAVRPLFLHLRSDPTRIATVLAALAEDNERAAQKTRASDGASLNRASRGSWDPRIVLDVCIEAYMAHRDVPGALTLFRSWHLYAPPSSRPALETFNALLFDLFKTPGARQVAQVLLQAIQDAGLRPDATTNNRLIFSFLADEADAEGLALALSVWKEMRYAKQDLYGFAARQLVERVKAAHAARPEEMEEVLQDVVDGLQGKE